MSVADVEVRKRSFKETAKFMPQAFGLIIFGFGCGV